MSHMNETWFLFYTNTDLPYAVNRICCTGAIEVSDHRWLTLIPLRLRQKKKTVRADSPDSLEFPFADFLFSNSTLFFKAYPWNAVVTSSPLLRISNDWTVSYKELI